MFNKQRLKAKAQDRKPSKASDFCLLPLVLLREEFYPTKSSPPLPPVPGLSGSVVSPSALDDDELLTT